MSTNDSMQSGVCCSFCGKPQDAVDRLIAGPGVFICNECIELCQTLLDPEEVPVRHRSSKKEEAVPQTLPTPHEIKEKLDEYLCRKRPDKK